MKKNFQAQSKIKLGKGNSLHVHMLHVLHSEKFVLVLLEAGMTPVFVGDIKVAVKCLKLFDKIKIK